MSGLPWYRCEPTKFNDGMVGLTPAERGFYATVINCIYIEGGPVKDEPLYWAALFGCSQAQWLKGRAGLVAKGKLYECPTADGLPGLMNRRACAELDNQFRFRSEQAERGAKGGAKSRRKPRVDKGLSRASATAYQPLSDRLATAKPNKREMKSLSPSQEGAIGEDQGNHSTGEVIALGRGSAR